MTEPLFAAHSGSGDKVLVLLHGFGGTHHVWEGVAAALSEQCQVIVYDLPGHGQSLGYPEAGPVKIAVKAVLADLTRRGIEKFHLAGHSMGGAISALIALGAPERVASLTLLCPGGFGPEINIRLLTRYGAAKTADDIRACLENMYGWSNPVPEQAVEASVEMRTRPGQTGMLARIVQGMSRNGVQGTIPREQLATLPMPVKVLWGRQDRVLPTRQAHKLPPHFAAHLFEDTGHMLVDEQSASVIHLLAENIR